MSLSFNCKGQLNDYPKEIKRLGIQNLYDKTKWFLYCGVGNQNLHFRNKKNVTNKKVTYAMLPMKFENLLVRGDSFELNFRFLYNDNIVSSGVVDNSPVTGCVFYRKSDKILEIVNVGDFHYFSYGCTDPKHCRTFEEDISKPEIINYIKQNKNILDPWFRKEAVKRGVISE